MLEDRVAEKASFSGTVADTVGSTSAVVVVVVVGVFSCGVRSAWLLPRSHTARCREDCCCCCRDGSGEAEDVRTAAAALTSVDIGAGEGAETGADDGSNSSRVTRWR